jgi:hypothetical protein
MKKEWTIIGALGTIDYMGNDMYKAHFNDEIYTHVFNTKELPLWLKRMEVSSDAYKGINTSAL